MRIPATSGLGLLCALLFAGCLAPPPAKKLTLGDRPAATRLAGTWSLPNFPQPGDAATVYFGKDGYLECRILHPSSPPPKIFTGTWAVTHDVLTLTWQHDTSPHPRLDGTLRITHADSRQITLQTADHWRYFLRRIPDTNTYP